jgi:hypothetical protein
MIGLGGLADRAKDVSRSEVSGKVGGTRGGWACATAGIECKKSHTRVGKTFLTQLLGFQRFPSSFSPLCISEISCGSISCLWQQSKLSPFPNYYFSLTPPLPPLALQIPEAYRAFVHIDVDSTHSLEHRSGCEGSRDKQKDSGVT